MTRDLARTVAIVAVVALLVSAAIVAAVTFTSEPTTIEGEVPVAVTNGPEVVIVADSPTEANMEDIWGTEELNIETEHGVIDIGGDPGVTATINVNDIEGTQTIVTDISGGTDWLYLDPGDKQRLDIRGDVNAVQFRNVTVDDGTTDLEVVGTSGGTAEFRLYDLSSSQTYVLFDPASGEVLKTAATNSSGTLDTSVDLQSSNQQIEVRTVDSFAEPVLSNPQPEGNVTEIPDELSVDLDGDAYPVDVTFSLEGETVGTVEATEDGTVSTPVDLDGLGTYNWSATATDAAGQTDTVDVSFSTPSELVIREEHDPQTTVSGSTLTLRFYTTDGEIVIERETTDGTLDMAGLPDSDFVVFVESDNHYDRRVYLDSIFEQEDLFVLNETEFTRDQNDAVSSRFTYTDLTGQFPRSDTTLQVQRAIDVNGDGTSEWRTVAGDFWGAGGEFEVILEHGARYRLFVQNSETGATNTVGAHIPTEDLVYEIRTSGLTQEAEDASGVYANAQLDTDDSVIEFVYDDPAERTEELTVRITSRNGNETIYNETIAGPLGSYQGVVELNESQLEDDWIVEIESNRHTVAIPVGSGSAGTPVAVPGWLMTLLMCMAVTFGGSLYGPRTAVMGAWAMVFVASGVAMFGWAFGWPSIIAAMLIAVGATFYGKVMP